MIFRLDRPPYAEIVVLDLYDLSGDDRTTAIAVPRRWLESLAPGGLAIGQLFQINIKAVPPVMPTDGN